MRHVAGKRFAWKARHMGRAARAVLCGQPYEPRYALDCFRVEWRLRHPDGPSPDLARYAAAAWELFEPAFREGWEMVRR